MVVYRLICKLFLATSICIVAISQDPGSRALFGQKVLEPKNAVLSRPRFFTVAIQAMDGDDAVRAIVVVKG